MKTLVLDAETGNLSINHLLNQASDGGVEVRDVLGNTVALVVSPLDRDSRTYIEADLYLKQHEERIRQALARRGGITTAELLKRAAAAGNKVAEG